MSQNDKDKNVCVRMCVCVLYQIWFFIYLYKCFAYLSDIIIIIYQVEYYQFYSIIVYKLYMMNDS